MLAKTRTAAVAAAAILAPLSLAVPTAADPSPEEEDAGALAFEEGAGAASLASRLADLAASGWSARWRLQSREPGYRQARIYQRLEWKAPGGPALYALAEKDPGEGSWRDFASVYVSADLAGFEAVAGDLRPGFAQGLVFSRHGWRGGAAMPRPRRDSRATGYRSSAENHSLRGLSLRRRGPGFEAAASAGAIRLDARVDDSGGVTSLPQSGYHVSPAERRNADRLGGQVGVLRLRGERGRLSIGTTLLKVRFSRSVDLRRPGRVEYAFNGRGQSTAGFDLVWRARRLQGFGELAVQDRGHLGWVGGLRLSGRRLKAGVLLRAYDPGYHAFFGGAPGAGGMKNERGILVMIGHRRAGLRFYVDRYRRPQRTYFYPMASEHTLLGAEWSLARPLKSLRGRGSEELQRALGGLAAWNPKLSLRQRLKPVWKQGEATAAKSRKIRFDLQQKGEGRLQMLRLRLESGQVRTGSQSNRASNASVSARLRLGALRCSGHLSRFRVDSWDARIYEFEYDLPGAVSIRALNGVGWRAYGLLELGKAPVAATFRYRFERRRGREDGHLASFQLDLAGN